MKRFLDFLRSILANSDGYSPMTDEETVKFLYE